VFISGGNPHLTSRFCGVVLGPTTSSKRLNNLLIIHNIHKAAKTLNILYPASQSNNNTRILEKLKLAGYLL